MTHWRVWPKMQIVQLYDAENLDNNETHQRVLEEDSYYLCGSDHWFGAFCIRMRLST